MKALRHLSLVALCLVATPASAQDDAEEAEDPGTNVETTHRVGGALADGPTRVESINSEDLERRGATNLAEALEWLSAGTQVSPTGTATGLLVDGLPTSQVTVLRDGLPITRATGSQQGPLVDLTSIAVSPASIERIDIYRGIGPVGTGSAGGVVIDIVSKEREPRSSVFGQSQIGVGAHQSVAADGLQLLSLAHTVGGEAGISRKVVADVLARDTRSAALDVDRDLDPDSPAFRGLYGEGAVTWRPATGEFLRVQAIGSTSVGETLGGPDGVFDDLVARDSAHLRTAGRWWVHDDVRLDHRHDVGTNQQDFTKRVISSGFERPKSETDFLDTTHNVAATWFVGDHDLAGEVAANAYRVHREGETGVLPTETELQVGLGLADTWYLSTKVETFARAFGEVSSAYGPALNAQANVAIRPVKTIGFRASAARSRRAPTPEELYLFFDHSEVGYQVTGNADLRPETLNSFQLASLLHTKDRTAGLELMGFYHYLTNVITIVDVEGSPGLFSYENRAAAHTAGLQATAEVTVFRTLTMLGNYTWTPVAVDAEEQARLTLRAEHAGRFEVRQTFFDRHLQVWADTSARSSMSVPDGSPPAQAHALLGFGISASFSAYRLLLDVNNLLDHTNADWGPMPGRHVLLSLSGRFDFQRQ